MSDVVEAFTRVSGYPPESFPAEPTNNPPTEAHQGLCALLWLRCHAAEWLRAAGLTDLGHDRLEDRAGEITLALAKIEPGKVEPEHARASSALAVAVWGELAPIRAGMEAAGRAAGLGQEIDVLAEMARVGHELVGKLGGGLPPMFVQALQALASACLYEMITGEKPVAEPEVVEPEPAAVAPEEDDYVVPNADEILKDLPPPEEVTDQEIETAQSDDGDTLPLEAVPEDQIPEVDPDKGQEE